MDELAYFGSSSLLIDPTFGAPSGRIDDLSIIDFKNIVHTPSMSMARQFVESIKISNWDSYD